MHLTSRRTWITVLLLAALGGYWYYGSGSEPVVGFRGTSWGMTRDEIKLLERDLKITSQDERMLRYFGVAGNLGEKTTSVNLVYGFEDNRLVAGCYGFNLGHAVSIAAEDGKALQEYWLLKDQLTRRFGQPSVSEEEQDRSVAAGAGGDSVVHNNFTVWRTPETVIELKLRERQPWLKLPYTFDLCYIESDYFSRSG